MSEQAKTPAGTGERGTTQAKAGGKGRGRPSYRIFRTLQTRWADNDLYGHMNNVVHYALFDTAVNGWLLEEGAMRLHEGPMGLVVETGCRYFAEIGFPDVVTAGLRVVRLGGSAVTYEIGLFRGDADWPAAEGFFVHVNVDRKSRRPVPIEGELRALLESAWTEEEVAR